MGGDELKLVAIVQKRFSDHFRLFENVKINPYPEQSRFPHKPAFLPWRSNRKKPEKQSKCYRASFITVGKLKCLRIIIPFGKLSGSYSLPKLRPRVLPTFLILPVFYDYSASFFSCLPVSRFVLRAFHDFFWHRYFCFSA